MPTLCGMEEIQRVMKETEDRYYWVIKLHPHLEEKGMKSNCDLPSEKIFAVADLLITDYSSILFDYMAYKKPFLFFAPDFDSFDHARGFYVPYYSFPCKVVTDGAGLPAAIEYELSDRLIPVACTTPEASRIVFVNTGTQHGALTVSRS